MEFVVDKSGGHVTNTIPVQRLNEDFLVCTLYMVYTL